MSGARKRKETDGRGPLGILSSSTLNSRVSESQSRDKPDSQLRDPKKIRQALSAPSNPSQRLNTLALLLPLPSDEHVPLENPLPQSSSTVAQPLPSVPLENPLACNEELPISGIQERVPTSLQESDDLAKLHADLAKAQEHRWALQMKSRLDQNRVKVLEITLNGMTESHSLLLTKSEKQKQQIKGLKEEVAQLKNSCTQLNLLNKIQKTTIESLESEPRPKKKESSYDTYEEKDSTSETIAYYRSHISKLEKDISELKSAQLEAEAKAEEISDKMKQYMLDYARKAELEAQAEYESKEKWKTTFSEQQEFLQTRLEKNIKELTTTLRKCEKLEEENQQLKTLSSRAP